MHPRLVWSCPRPCFEWLINVVTDGAASYRSFLSLQICPPVCCSSLESSLISRPSLTSVAHVTFVLLVTLPSLQFGTVVSRVVYIHYALEQASHGIFTPIQTRTAINRVASRRCERSLRSLVAFLRHFRLEQSLCSSFTSIWTGKAIGGVD